MKDKLPVDWVTIIAMSILSAIAVWVLWMAISGIYNRQACIEAYGDYQIEDVPAKCMAAF